MLLHLEVAVMLVNKVNTKETVKINERKLWWDTLTLNEEAKRLFKEIRGNNQPKADALGLPLNLYLSANHAVESFEHCEDFITNELLQWIADHKINNDLEATDTVLSAITAWSKGLIDYPVLDVLAKYLMLNQFKTEELQLTRVHVKKVGRSKNRSDIDWLMDYWENNCSINKIAPNDRSGFKNRMTKAYGKGWKLFTYPCFKYHESLLEAYKLWKKINF